MKENDHTLLRNKLQSLKAVQMTSEEQNAMRSRLLSYADLHTAYNKSVPRRFSWFSFQTSSRIFVSGALVLILLVGSTGAAFAAQNTLPGEPLYAVKVNITEPIEGAIIDTTSGTVGDANWQNTLAERRLNEASTLAAENNLASTTQTYLAEQVDVHVDQSEQDSDQLAQNGNVTAALAVRSDLEARLGAHATLLALVASRLEANGDASTTDQVALFLNHLSTEKAEVAYSANLAATSSIAVLPTHISALIRMQPSIESETSTMNPDFEASDTSATDTATIEVAVAPVASPGVRTEEASLLRSELHILNLLPVLHTSSTTASTTSSTTAVSNDASTSAQSEGRVVLPLLKP